VRLSCTTWTPRPAAQEHPVRDQLHDLIVSLKEANEIPVLVAVDAEGGFYNRLKEK